MKKLIVLSIVLVTFAVDSYSQSVPEMDTEVMPSWISTKGYWVIEGNIKTPDTNTVYFYNNDNVLVYKEKLEGIVLNLKKFKVKMRLKKVLEQSIISFDVRKAVAENQSMLASLYK